MTSASPQPQNRTEFATVLQTSLSVAAAYVPLGAAKAILMLGVGMDWYWPLITAAIVYAGSLEFLIVGYVASGLSLPLVAWTILLINFRLLFYGLSYPMRKHGLLSAKLYGMFALTDEVYVVTSLGKGKGFDGRSLILFQSLLQFWWFFGACLGVLVGQWLPSGFGGFEFALTAMFVILALDSLRSTQSHRTLLLVLAAIIAGYICEFKWQKDSFLVAGLLTYFALLNGYYLWNRGWKNA